jgi:hypothetical protein
MRPEQTLEERIAAGTGGQPAERGDSRQQAHQSTLWRLPAACPQEDTGLPQGARDLPRRGGGEATAHRRAQTEKDRELPAAAVCCPGQGQGRGGTMKKNKGTCGFCGISGEWVLGSYFRQSDVKGRPLDWAASFPGNIERLPKGCGFHELERHGVLLALACPKCCRRAEDPFAPPERRQEEQAAAQVVARSFEALRHPKGSPERTRLNLSSLTSEYLPEYRFQLSHTTRRPGRGPGITVFRTREEGDSYLARVAKDAKASPIGADEGGTAWTRLKSCGAASRRSIFQRGARSASA